MESLRRTKPLHSSIQLESQQTNNARVLDFKEFRGLTKAISRDLWSEVIMDCHYLYRLFTNGQK